MYFIGVDNGSTRTRTVVWNLESASLAAQSEQSYGLVPGLPQGLLEQDPPLWDHAVDPTVRDCLAQLGGLVISPSSIPWQRTRLPRPVVNRCNATRDGASSNWRPSDVRPSGRIASHPAWRPLLADVLGLPVQSAKSQSGPALGAALQAAVTFFQQSGKNLTYAKITSYAAHPEQASLCAPDLARHEFYRELMERQERFPESLQEDTFQEDSPWLTTRDPHQLESSGGRHHHGMDRPHPLVDHSVQGGGSWWLYPPGSNQQAAHLVRLAQPMLALAMARVRVYPWRKGVVLTSASHDGAPLAAAVNGIGVGHYGARPRAGDWAS
jgi:hypothetical protein